MTRALLCCAVALGLAAPSAALEAARAPAVAVWVRSEIPFVVAVVNPALPPAAAVARAEPAPAGVLVDVDPPRPGARSRAGRP